MPKIVLATVKPMTMSMHGIPVGDGQDKPVGGELPGRVLAVPPVVGRLAGVPGPAEPVPGQQQQEQGRPLST